MHIIFFEKMLNLIAFLLNVKRTNKLYKTQNRANYIIFLIFLNNLIEFSQLFALKFTLVVDFLVLLI